MTTLTTSFDDKSYPKSEPLTKGCVDSFITAKIDHLPGESFEFGSTYPWKVHSFTVCNKFGAFQSVWRPKTLQI